MEENICCICGKEITNENRTMTHPYPITDENDRKPVCVDCNPYAHCVQIANLHISCLKDFSVEERAIIKGKTEAAFKALALAIIEVEEELGAYKKYGAGDYGYTEEEFKEEEKQHWKRMRESIK